MGKPPTTDQELTQRVAALEQRADATDAALEAMDADIENLEFRIIALEDGATTPPVTPPGGEIDNTLPEPEPPTQPIVPPEPPVVGGLSATYVVPSGPRAGSYVYSEAGGDGQAVTVLDDYHDPDGEFTMTCIAVVRDDAPLQVIFRQVPGWSCVIFECCDALATTNQHMMPDSATRTRSSSPTVVLRSRRSSCGASGRWDGGAGSRGRGRIPRTWRRCVPSGGCRCTTVRRSGRSRPHPGPSSMHRCIYQSGIRYMSLAAAIHSC